MNPNYVVDELTGTYWKIVIEDGQIKLESATDPTPSLGDLTTLAMLKSYLSLDVTTHDTLLQNIITQVSYQIQVLCNRIFASASYTEYYSGKGNNFLLLRQYPVSAITSIYDDTDRLYSADTLISSDDYALEDAGDSGIVKFDGLILSRGLNNIKVVYTAGYTTIPSDLEMACVKRCAADYIESLGGINAMEGETLTYKPYNLRKEADKIIERYKKPNTP